LEFVLLESRINGVTESEEGEKVGGILKKKRGDRVQPPPPMGGCHLKLWCGRDPRQRRGDLGSEKEP